MLSEAAPIIPFLAFLGTTVSNSSLRAEWQFLPAMKSGMTFFDGDKHAAASGANFPASGQLSVNRSAVRGRFDDLSGKKYPIVRRCRTKELDRVVRGYGAGRMIFASLSHEMIRSCPVAVAIEQRADNAAIQNPGESFVTRLRFPFRDDLRALREAADAQTLRIRRTATPAGIVRRKAFLERKRTVVRHRNYLAPSSEAPL
jgi:hypothetical protein